MLLATALASAETSAPAPDFTPAFEKLVALGMPPLGPDAVWSASRETAGNSYQFRELSRSLKGNAWSVPAPDGKFRLLAMAAPAFADEIQPKAPKPADLAKDVEQIIAGLSKAAEEAQKREMFDMSPDFPAGSVLLFAAQIHQTGRKDLANQLALAVFRSVSNREEVVDLAVSSLADVFYQKAAGAFFENGDWAALKHSLDDLLKRYPRGWRNRAAVALMLPQLAKQAAGEKPAPTALKEVDLDPGILELTLRLMDQPPEKPAEKPKSGLSARDRAMLEYRRERGFTPPSLWVLKKADSEQEEEPSDESDPFAPITGLRMKAIPVLAALADDPAFTHFPNSSSSYYSSYHSSRDSEEEQILNAYRGLFRPLSRGEIASKLLAATLPDHQNELSEADAATLREQAITFWKEHRNDTDSQLAACFLTEGDERQSSSAGEILAKSSNPEDQKLFEKHVLASEDAIQLFQSVQNYLRTRKSAAKPFFDEYAKLVRSQNVGGAQEEYNGRSWMIREAGGVDKILKQMEGLVGGQSPKSFAVQVAKGDPKEAEQGIRALTAMVADLSPVKRLYVMLEGANAAKDAGVRSRFIRATLPNDSMGQEIEPAEKSPPERKLIDAELVVWRNLTADDRLVPPEIGHEMNLMGGKTVGDLANVALEFSVTPNCRYRAYQAARIVDQPASELIRARVQARLAGQTVPDFPNPSRVSAERLKAIVAEAGSKEAPAIPSYLLTLSPDERAAWSEWMSEPKELAVPESVRKLRLLVVRRAKESPAELPLLEDCGSMQSGFEVSVESVRGYVGDLGKDLEKHSREYIQISSVGFGPGLEFSGVRFPVPAKPKSNDEEEMDGFAPSGFGDAESTLNSAISAFDEHESADGVIVVHSYFENTDGVEMVWIVKDGVAKPADPEDAATFDENLKQGLAWESGDCEISFRILSKTDALKFKFKTKDSTDPLDLLPPP